MATKRQVEWQLALTPSWVVLCHSMATAYLPVKWGSGSEEGPWEGTRMT